MPLLSSFQLPLRFLLLMVFHAVGIFKGSLKYYIPLTVLSFSRIRFFSLNSFFFKITIYLFVYYIFFCVYMCEHDMCVCQAAHVEGRGQFLRVLSSYHMDPRD